MIPLSEEYLVQSLITEIPLSANSIIYQSRVYFNLIICEHIEVVYFLNNQDIKNI